jgi:hypothetical protein
MSNETPSEDAPRRGVERAAAPRSRIRFASIDIAPRDDSPQAVAARRGAEAGARTDF